MLRNCVREVVKGNKNKVIRKVNPEVSPIVFRKEEQQRATVYACIDCVRRWLHMHLQVELTGSRNPSISKNVVLDSIVII